MAEAEGAAGKAEAAAKDIVIVTNNSTVNADDKPKVEDSDGDAHGGDQHGPGDDGKNAGAQQISTKSGSWVWWHVPLAGAGCLGVIGACMVSDS